MMTSLTTRMTLFFAGSGIMLALCYWILLFSFLLLPEDVIFTRQLNIELQRQQSHYTQHGAFAQLPGGMTLYLGDQINSHPDAGTIIRLPPGVGAIGYLNLHIAKSTSGSEPLYIIYDVDHQNIDPTGILSFNRMLLHSLYSTDIHDSPMRTTDK